MASAEPFDRRDARAVHVRGGHEARVDRHSVDEHRALAAFTLAASFLGSRERAVFAEHVEQTLQRVHVDPCPSAVQRQTHDALTAKTAKNEKKLLPQRH